MREWGYESSGPLFEHLKKCPHNQDKDKVIRTEWYQLKELGLLDQGGQESEKGKR